tara:strand:+ start:744 stop:1670 length:927 start_codon:yes stop_codon:yes gene_type:complete
MSNIQMTNKTITIKTKKRFVPLKHKKFKAWFNAVDTIFKTRAVETCFKNFGANKRFAKLLYGMNQANILRIEEVNNKTLTKVWGSIVTRAQKHYRRECLEAWAKSVRGDDAGKGECPICYGKAHLVKLTCGHGYCETCLPQIKVVKSGAQERTTQTFKCAMRCGDKMVKLPKHKIPQKVGAWVPEGQKAVGGKVRKTRGGCHEDAYWCSTKKVPRGIDADDEIVFKKDSHKTNPKRKGKGEKPSISWARWQECIIDHPNGPPEYAEQWFKRGMNKGDWDDAIKRGLIEINVGVALSDSDSEEEEVFME